MYFSTTLMTFNNTIAAFQILSHYICDVWHFFFGVVSKNVSIKSVSNFLRIKLLFRLFRLTVSEEAWI